MGEKILQETFMNCLSWREQIAVLERDNADYARHLARRRERSAEKIRRKKINNICYLIIEILLFLLIGAFPFYGLFL